jgi:hypothetical protein
MAWHKEVGSAAVIGAGVDLALGSAAVGIGIGATCALAFIARARPEGGPTELSLHPPPGGSPPEATSVPGQQIRTCCAADTVKLRHIARARSGSGTPPRSVRPGHRAAP